MNMSDTHLIETLDYDQLSEFDAMAKLQPGEPYFLLLGRDRLAPPLVQKWAWDNRERALREFEAGLINEEKRDRELDKSRDAEARGWAMTAYKAGDLAKQAAGEPTVKTYSGADVPEETKQRDRLAAARNVAAAALHNAVGQLAEVVDALGPFEGTDAQLADLANVSRAAAEEMGALAERVVSWRPIGVKRS